MQFSTLNVFLGIVWILTGIFWIRRAYVCQAEARMALKPFSDRTTNLRARAVAAFSLGGANLLIGIFELALSRR
jgi:hypothetical protein